MTKTANDQRSTEKIRIMVNLNKLKIIVLINPTQIITLLKKKQNVHKGNDLLVRYGYFTKEVNTKNRRTFLYTEKMKSQNLCKIKNNIKIENILNIKLSDIPQKIKNKSSELAFMEKLINEHLFVEELLKNRCISENEELIVHKKLLFRLIYNFELLKKEVS